jgi:hypothetical protein
VNAHNQGTTALTRKNNSATSGFFVSASQSKVGDHSSLKTNKIGVGHIWLIRQNRQLSAHSIYARPFTDP